MKTQEREIRGPVRIQFRVMVVHGTGAKQKFLSKIEQEIGLPSQDSVPQGKMDDHALTLTHHFLGAVQEYGGKVAQENLHLAVFDAHSKIGLELERRATEQKKKEAKDRADKGADSNPDTPAAGLEIEMDPEDQFDPNHPLDPV